MAAKELCRNYHVIILEANDRLGGRMHTVEGNGFTNPVEAGAEFVHGKVPVTLGLLKKAGIEYEKTGGEMYRFNNGKWVEEEEQVDGWDELMNAMKDLKEDTTLQLFLQEYFAGEKFAKFRDQVTRFAEGFDVADIAKVSVVALRDEWVHESGVQYRITGGYKRLIDYMADACLNEGCEIHTNSLVKQIDWQPNDVTVYTMDGKKYYASKVIVTVPVIMLQKVMDKGSINFTPALDEYVHAANQVGYGDVVKVVLEFKQPFWNKYKKDLGFIISDEWMPVWWTQLPAAAPTLTGWLGGPKASALKHTSDEVILQKSLQSICTIFGMSNERMEAQITSAKVFNWAKNEFAEGAYSYATPGTKKALSLLTTPVEGTIFFAGEAICDGPHPGTVEAALVSGKEAAGRILKAG